nr:MAG TPA: hypothetical protein [Caudoviricetes sp.]
MNWCKSGVKPEVASLTTVVPQRFLSSEASSSGTSHRILHHCSSCVISAFQTRNQELFSVF